MLAGPTRSRPILLPSDQPRSLALDRCIKIDDSYEHEVFQQSDRRRVLFILDLPHPELLPEELEFLQEIMRCSPAHSAGGDVFEKAGPF